MAVSKTRGFSLGRARVRFAIARRWIIELNGLSCRDFQVANCWQLLWPAPTPQCQSATCANLMGDTRLFSTPTKATGSEARRHHLAAAAHWRQPSVATSLPLPIPPSSFRIKTISNCFSGLLRILGQARRQLFAEPLERARDQ